MILVIKSPGAGEGAGGAIVACKLLICKAS